LTATVRAGAATGRAHRHEGDRPLARLGHDSRSDNLNPARRAYDSFSPMLCTPNALSQGGELALKRRGAAARRSRAGGFTRVRRAAETPVDLVLEARP
jgi:hypothetical protein